MLQIELKKQMERKKEASLSIFRQYKKIKVDNGRPQIQKQQGIAIKKVNFRPQIFIHNRENVYGYILQDLVTVYKFFGFSDLDYSSLKAIKKLGTKNDILEETSIQVAAQMLINTSNQQIKKTINQYNQSYYKKYPFTNKKSFSNYSWLKRLRRQTAEASKKKIQLKWLQQSTPKFNQERIQEEIKRMKLANASKAKKFNLQFPIITKNKCNYDIYSFPNLQSKEKDKKGKQTKFYKANQYQKINASEITIIKPSSQTTNLYSQIQSSSMLLKQILSEDSFKDQLKLIFKEKLRQENNKYKLKKFNPQQLGIKPKLPNLFMVN